jgi:hypothetical protein
MASKSDLVRRSNRRQKVRGEKEIVVNSGMLLRDLKVKVPEVFINDQVSIRVAR